MKIDEQVMEALELLERERGVPVDTILDALANALVSAYKRSPGAAEEARVVIDSGSGDIVVYAQELDEDGNVVKEWEDTPEDFGRIAAQTAKQVIAQRLREAKRDQVFDVYEGREGDLVTGIIQQVDYRYSILDLGDAEALLPGSERIPYERLERGNRVKAFVLEVRNEAKGPQIVVSRSHPDFVRRLLELEVPELIDGTIEIKAIAREPGNRTKIAVSSNDPNVDPKGACVGARGARVRQVVNELRGEKVDVVEWREDQAQFIAEALGPAKVQEVRIDEENETAVVVVSDHQLSLAIGKEGQNARLAARLSGYRVDIRSDIEESGAGAARGEAEAGQPDGEVAGATDEPATDSDVDGAVEEPASDADVDGAVEEPASDADVDGAVEEPASDAEAAVDVEEVPLDTDSEVVPEDAPAEGGSEDIPVVEDPVEVEASSDETEEFGEIVESDDTPSEDE